MFCLATDTTSIARTKCCKYWQTLFFKSHRDRNLCTLCVRHIIGVMSRTPQHTVGWWSRRRFNNLRHVLNARRFNRGKWADTKGQENYDSAETIDDNDKHYGSGHLSGICGFVSEQTPVTPKKYRQLEFYFYFIYFSTTTMPFLFIFIFFF